MIERLPSLVPRLWPAARLIIAVLGLVVGGCKTIPTGKSAVDDLTIRGADAVDTGDIEDKIATTPNAKFIGLFPGVVYEYSIFDRFVLQRDLARVEALYRTRGYYDAHARAGRIFQLDDKHVRVEIAVEEGKPVVVRKVRVDGLEGIPKPVADAVRRAAESTLPAGKPFEEEAFEKAEGNVRRALTDNGYAYAKATSGAAVDIVAHAADAVFVVKPGPVCVYGPVTIEGLGSLPERPVRRALDIRPDRPYSQAALDSAQQALLDLGVFASVTLEPVFPGTEAEKTKGAGSSQGSTSAGQTASAGASNSPEAQPEPSRTPDPPPPSPDGKPTVVPIKVTVEPSRLRSIRLGGGVEFDALKTDVHGVVGWEHRNFFGGMRTFSVRFKPGLVLYPLRVNNIVAPTHVFPEERLTFELRQPGFLEARTNGFIRPQFDIYPVLLNPDPPPDQNVLGYAEFRTALGVDRTIWKLYAALTYNIQVDYPFSYLGPKDPTLGTIIISYPELFLAFDFRDDKIHPRKGVFLANTLQYAGGLFRGNAHDWKIQPDLRGYVPVAKKTVLAARVSVGFIQPYNYGDTITRNVSEFDRAADETRDYQLTFFRGFFSGGPSSNRGYPIRGVGPYAVVPFLTPEVAQQNIANDCTDQCRSPTGGFTLWEGSVEMRFSLNGPLSIATFCDASDVSPHVNDIRLSHLHLSCGAGGRYDTPVGPVRLDVGYRLPGLQVLGGLTPDEREPTDFFGIPIAVHIGIGEAY